MGSVSQQVAPRLRGNESLNKTCQYPRIPVSLRQKPIKFLPLKATTRFKRRITPPPEGT
jgi:hypothetical protein